MQTWHQELTSLFDITFMWFFQENEWLLNVYVNYHTITEIITETTKY